LIFAPNLQTAAICAGVRRELNIFDEDRTGVRPFDYAVSYIDAMAASCQYRGSRERSRIDCSLQLNLGGAASHFLEVQLRCASGSWHWRRCSLLAGGGIRLL
jgi:hypothetical protein